ncbi:MAG: GTPase HflX [Treponemataceae bacterium]|nr:GTPase HflX [Treponemataceae bacterium]
MSNILHTANSEKRAFLVGIRDNSMSDEAAHSLTRELSELARTLGLQIVDQEVVRIRESHPRYGIGKGKAEEIARRLADQAVDCLVFDIDLTPSQQRNWEELCGVSALDRQELIIQIFASRAQTKEAELQVELARLKHRLPRLSHTELDLSQQRGGRYSTRGAGEKKLELDRRAILRRIHQLEKEIAEIRQHRATQRKRRDRVPIPSCVLVGYTNAGKSSLLNALTNAHVLVEDKLFATLDPTTRRIELRRGRPLLLTDTVGFIRRLPHHLVEAFKATLEEATQADLLLVVLDASDPERDQQYHTTLDVLSQLGAQDIPRLVVLNKIDLLVDPKERQHVQQQYGEALPVSARTGEGLDTLRTRIEDMVGGSLCDVRIPISRYDLVARLHQEGCILEEHHKENDVLLRVRLDKRIAGQFQEWIIN